MVMREQQTVGQGQVRAYSQPGMNAAVPAICASGNPIRALEWRKAKAGLRG